MPVDILVRLGGRVGVRGDEPVLARQAQRRQQAPRAGVGERHVAGEAFDLLMIGSPNHLHLDHIRIGLEAGLTVFTEKPIVTSIEESYTLASLLNTYGHDRLLVGLVLRYSPLYRDLRKAQEEGRLGNVVSIEASEHIQPYHGAFFMRDWRRYGRYAGGFMLEKCCHDLDLYNGVVGARPRFVASFGGRKSFVPENAPEAEGINDLNVYHRKPSGWMGSDKVFDSDGDIVDFQTAMVEYENGSVLSFHTNLSVPDDFRRYYVQRWSTSDPPDDSVPPSAMAKLPDQNSPLGAQVRTRSSAFIA